VNRREGGKKAQGRRRAFRLNRVGPDGKLKMTVGRKSKAPDSEKVLKTMGSIDMQSSRPRNPSTEKWSKEKKIADKLLFRQSK